MTPMQDIDRRFAYHAPGHQLVVENHTEIRAGARELAELIVAIIPPGREQALALTKVEEAMFWANAAIARGQIGAPG